MCNCVSPAPILHKAEADIVTFTQIWVVWLGTYIPLFQIQCLLSKGRINYNYHQRWILGNVNYICLCKKGNKVESALALKPRGDITRNPKQGNQWPPYKELCPSKKFFLKKVFCVFPPTHAISIH